ncbi:hypothetical protein EDB19DRAFT_1627551 [Suillus lakei]|nr:hypothetical protein EDB19DRAFT_1627551 [Suillus lakei]
MASPAPQDESSSEAIPTFGLTTPPRRLSSSTSILDFRTPSPPHDLSNLSALPSSSEDEAETREADVTPLRVDEGDLTNPNYTAMKTPRPPGAWAATPIPPKHPRDTSPPPTPSEVIPTASSTPLSRANSGPERGSKTEAPAGNGLLTPIPSLSRANSLPLRTPAPPGAWMLTPNQPTTQNGQNGSADQSQFGSLGRRKSILKVRFDVTESEASTAEVDHQKSPLPSGRVSVPDFLPDGHARRAESVPSKMTNGSAHADAVHDPVPARPVTPERPTTPISRANVLSPRSLRKSPTVKVVDAFGRERIDDLPTPADAQDIADGRTDAKDATCSPSSPHTPRSQHKSNIRIVDAMGREIEEEAVPVIEPLFEEELLVLHDDSPVGRTETLAQMRQTLREWADGLSDGDRSADDLALNTSHLEELEEVSRAARHARNQLAQTLCVESVKERDLMHKYAKDAPAIVGDNSSFYRGLVLLGVVVQIIFVLAMWRFAHVQARRLFNTVYYDPLYPELNPLPGHSHQFSPPYPSFPWSLSSAYDIVRHEGWTALKAELQGTVRRIGKHAWERWGERPYTGTWPPT